jgi:hypothetical protein
MKLLYIIGVILLSLTFSTAYVKHWSLQSRSSPKLIASKLRVDPLNIIKSIDDKDDDIDFETGFTKRKGDKKFKKPDNRDALPFVVLMKTRDDKFDDIGTYRLDPSTGKLIVIFV